MNAQEEKWLQAGRVGTPHGLDGSFNVPAAQAQWLTTGRTVTIDGVSRKIERRAGHDGRVIIRVSGCSDRDAAEALRGKEIQVPRSAAPALGADEWWAEDLEGCVVRDGELEVGTVKRLLALPSCEVLEVARNGGGELLVPLVSDAVRTVDVVAKTIDIDLSFLGVVEIDVFTLFPEWFEWFESQRHVRNAITEGHSLGYVNYRDHTPLTGGQVDDTPFGGGAGMVLRVDVVEAAMRARYDVDPCDVGHRRRVLAMTPGGRLLDDAFVDELVAEPALTILCGRYEGFDERILDHYVTDRVSIGKYVIAGGELAAMVVADAVLRKLPGALGHVDSALEESFSQALDGNPEYPHYTRPADYRGWSVPEVLLSGHHANIHEWRMEQSRLRGQAQNRA